jgi:glycolate oxidase FAD binding subunit
MRKGDLGMPNTDQLVSRLKEIAGEAHVLKDLDKLKAYALNGECPKVFVAPGTIEEVSKIVAFANQERVTIIPRGNGTKMGMGGIPKGMDLILSTLRLKRITDADVDNLTLSVESGITLGEVQKLLAKQGKGYFFPLDPPFTEQATLGGIVATNSSGPRRFIYGTARDLVIGIKTVFPNGDVVVSGGKTVKNVSGYDLGKSLIGSMGTLGVLCEMTCRLLPLPEKAATLLLPFAGLKEAGSFVGKILKSQLLPASIEMLNAATLHQIQEILPPLPKGNYLVAIGLEGVTESVDRQISELGEMGKKDGALEVVTLLMEKHQVFWKTLQDLPERLSKASPNLLALKSNFLISKGADMLGYHETLARDLGTDCALVCHCGNGILYSYVPVGEELPSRKNALIGFVEKLTTLAVKHEGNLVVESSPLAIKEKVNVWGEPRSDLRVVRRLKEEIDPAGILNPGRFVGGI